MERHFFRYDKEEWSEPEPKTIDHKQQYINHALIRKERREKEIVSGRENQQNERTGCHSYGRGEDVLSGKP